jgi:hypothetical protein
VQSSGGSHGVVGTVVGGQRRILGPTRRARRPVSSPDRVREQELERDDACPRIDHVGAIGAPSAQASVRAAARADANPWNGTWERERAARCRTARSNDSLAEGGAESCCVSVLLLMRPCLEDDTLVLDDHDSADVEKHGSLTRNRDVEDEPNVLQRLERPVGVVIDDQRGCLVAAERGA